MSTEAKGQSRPRNSAIPKQTSGRGRRKRGAQPGNLNALRHGFYSPRFNSHELTDLDISPQRSLEGEIAMLRVFMRRTLDLVDGMDDQDEMVRVLGALGVAALRVARLLQAQSALGNGELISGELSLALNEVMHEWGRK
jgi:hypothetical protein